MLSAQFYVFSKRKNSTRVPPLTALSRTFMITINDANSSLLAPEVRVTAPSDASTLITTNYCYIPHFNRYYYILDWVYGGDGTWTAVCQVDSLASWKRQIRENCGGYISRAYMRNTAVNAEATPAWEYAKNPYIYDTLYPAENFSLTYTEMFQEPFNINFETGTFIIGCVTTPHMKVVNGNDTTYPINPNASPTLGATTYYVVSAGEMRNFVGAMTATTTDDWANLGVTNNPLYTVYLNTQKTGMNPLQYLVSIKWFPFEAIETWIANGIITYPTEPIFLGGWNTNAEGYRLLKTWVNAPSLTQDSVNLCYNTTWIRDVDDLGDYSTEYFPPIEPYASYNIATPWGVFELDPNVMAQILREPKPANPSDPGGPNRKLAFRYEIDLISGMGKFYLYSNTITKLLFRRDVQIGQDIPITQITKDSFQQISNWASLVTRGLNDLPAGVCKGIQSMGSDTRVMGSAVRDTFDDVHKLMTFAPSANSTAATACAFTPAMSSHVLYITRYRTVNQMPDLVGRPYKQEEATLWRYSGFVQMDVARLDIPCTDIERNQIHDYMIGGFYIE